MRTRDRDAKAHRNSNRHLHRPDVLCPLAGLADLSAPSKPAGPTCTRRQNLACSSTRHAAALICPGQRTRSTPPCPDQPTASVSPNVNKTSCLTSRAWRLSLLAMDENTANVHHDDSPAPTSSHRRAASGSSLLSRFPFMRASADTKPRQEAGDEGAPPAHVPAIAAAVQQHKTRRRRGSLRKVALLGRGAQRDRREGRPLTIDTSHAADVEPNSSRSPSSGAFMADHDALGLKVADLPQRPPGDAQGSSQSTYASSPTSASTTGPAARGHADRDGERSNSYTSTTDEEDLLQIPPTSQPPRAGSSMSSGSESYFENRGTGKRRRSFQQAKSPLSYSGISTNALPPPDSDWDYSETEWWGWVVLTVTWFVFVIGMGSCLDIWFWAWDVGKTPYAPPELEDDPTLPIVGYYPALIIMTAVMAWVWVVVAWVGMKYFRHAKISGD